MDAGRFDEQLLRLWAEVSDAGDARAAALAAFRAAPVRARARRRRRLAVAAGTLALVAGGGATTAAAQNALPGDATYEVKLALERAEVALARGDAAEAEVWLGIAETRVEEAVRAGTEARYDAMPEIVTGYRSAVAQAQDLLIGLPEDDDAVELADRELATHQHVLAGLVDVVPAPARAALRRALESASDGGPPFPVPPVSPPTDRAPSPTTGDPDGVGGGQPRTGPPDSIPTPALPPHAEKSRDRP